MTWVYVIVGCIAVAGGVTGYVLSHVAKVKLEAKAVIAEMVAMYDKHAPNWRTCTCSSCADRRDQAGAPHPEAK